MSDKEKGLYQKYSVKRNDGKEISHGCFVLELKDPKARKAILTYAGELEKHEVDLDLAQDLRAWVAQHDKEEKPKDIMTFYRAVIIAANKKLDEESLNSVPPEDAEEYCMDGDLILPAVLTVDTSSYNEAQRELEEKKKSMEKSSEDPLLQMTINFVIDSFRNSEYTDFNRYWDDSDNPFKETLKGKYDVVGQAVLSRLEKMEL